MADLKLTSFRGGMNNTDPAIGLSDDQCVLMQNVELVKGMLGDRRMGSSAVTLPAFLSSCTRIPFIFRHVPTQDYRDAQLWVLGIDDNSGLAHLGYKDTTWHEVTISDTPDLTGYYPYRWQAVSLGGKLYFAYKSNKNRLHVWDGTAMRRVGIDAPAAAPTAADTASGGTFVGTRYYRVRFTVQAAGVTIRRSEPSDVLTKAPTGANTGLTVTKPADNSEGATHWELEASLEEDGDYYVLATTVIATTTVTDTTDYSLGYTDNELSEDEGDYSLIPSARYLVADEDRLFFAGNYEDDALASQVGCTPVANADGVGDHERTEFDTDPSLNLDAGINGPTTGVSKPILGGIWTFKEQAIYKLVRTNQRTRAYKQTKVAEGVGAIHGSVINGMDETGASCVYFIDPEMGPCRIGIGGLRRCGEDIRETWVRLNADATKVVCSSLFYPTKKQVFWNIPMDAGNTPTVRLVLHTDKARPVADGVRKGWTLWTGVQAQAHAMCLFADNIEAGTSRSRHLVPFVGLEGNGLLHLCDTGITDNGTAFAATERTKPYLMASLIKKFGVRSASVMAVANASAAIDIAVERDFGLEITKTVSDVSFAPVASETEVVKRLDNLKGMDMRVAQFTISDVDSPAGTWYINRIDVEGQES